MTPEPLMKVGSAIVYWHELSEDAPSRVRAVGLDDLKPLPIGTVAEHEICLAKYREKWYPCVVLIYDAGIKAFLRTHPSYIPHPPAYARLIPSRSAHVCRCMR